MSTNTTQAPECPGSWTEQITFQQLQHPKEIADRLREETPLAWMPVTGTYLATSWELCYEIANDSDNFESRALPWHNRVFGEPAIINTENELHAHLRKVLGTPVSARVIRGQIESRMRPTAKELIEKLKSQGDRAELMADYFELISVRCVADSYGFFDVPTDTLRDWFHGLRSGALNGAVKPDGSFVNPDGFGLAEQTRDEIRAYLDRKSKENPEDPDAVVARWVNVEPQEGLPATLDELLPSMLVVLLGGLQEPGHALGNTFFGLTTNPQQMKRVIEDHSLLPKAIAEGIRWISPLWGGPTRSAKHDMVFHGVPLKAGDTVHLVYGSANHDGAEFERPDDYDIDRDSHAHLAFGNGRHACLGSAIAPQIARVALEELFTAFPHIALDPERTPAAIGWPFHGPLELQVILGDPVETGDEPSAEPPAGVCPVAH